MTVSEIARRFVTTHVRNGMLDFGTVPSGWCPHVIVSHVEFVESSSSRFGLRFHAIVINDDTHDSFATVRDMYYDEIFKLNEQELRGLGKQFANSLSFKIRNCEAEVEHAK